MERSLSYRLAGIDRRARRLARAGRPGNRAFGSALVRLRPRWTAKQIHRNFNFRFPGLTPNQRPVHRAVVLQHRAWLEHSCHRALSADHTCASQFFVSFGVGIVKLHTGERQPLAVKIRDLDKGCGRCHPLRIRVPGRHSQLIQSGGPNGAETRLDLLLVQLVRGRLRDRFIPRQIGTSRHVVDAVDRSLELAPVIGELLHHARPARGGHDRGKIAVLHLSIDKALHRLPDIRDVVGGESQIVRHQDYRALNLLRP
jgi:hypothetical protein